MPKRPSVLQLRLIAKMRRHVTNIQADADDGFNDNNDEDDSPVSKDNDVDADAFDDRFDVGLLHIGQSVGTTVDNAVSQEEGKHDKGSGVGLPETHVGESDGITIGDNVEHEEASHVGNDVLSTDGFDDGNDIPVPDNNDSPVPDNNDDEFKDNNDHFDLNDDEDDSPVKDLSSGKQNNKSRGHYVYQKEENDDSSDDGQGDNTCDDSMENIEMAIFTDTSSFDVDKALVIRLLAVLIPLKVFLSTRLGGAYSETKQGNCALRLSNLLVWTALNSPEKKVLDETTLLPWMEEILRTEYNGIDAYCQYLEDTKLHAASTIRNYLYDYG